MSTTEQDADPTDPAPTERFRAPREPKQGISVRFPLALVEELRRLSVEHHRSFNGTVNEACKRYVRQMRSRAQRNGTEPA